MHQNNKTFLPNQSAHLSKIILFLNAGFLAYLLSACGDNDDLDYDFSRISDYRFH
ncbi:hypothetical protein ACQJ8G_07640 [Helicobacter pylori]